jgi:hypothetical protein
MFSSDDDIEIDEHAQVKVVEGGAFVAAWVWVCDFDATHRRKT